MDDYWESKKYKAETGTLFFLYKKSFQKEKESCPLAQVKQTETVNLQTKLNIHTEK